MSNPQSLDASTSSIKDGAPISPWVNLLRHIFGQFPTPEAYSQVGMSKGTEPAGIGPVLNLAENRNRTGPLVLPVLIVSSMLELVLEK